MCIVYTLYINRYHIYIYIYIISTKTSWKICPFLPVKARCRRSCRCPSWPCSPAPWTSALRPLRRPWRWPPRRCTRECTRHWFGRTATSAWDQPMGFCWGKGGVAKFKVFKYPRKERVQLITCPKGCHMTESKHFWGFNCCLLRAIFAMDVFWWI